MNLNEKVALVTGASRGIGAEVALKLASRGCNIAINYLGENAIEEATSVKNEIEKLGVKAIIIDGDVTDFKSSENLVKSTIEQLGKIDILVNNAGITIDTLIMRMSEEAFSNVINVNLKGAFNMIKHVNRPMFKQRSGRIINMASVIGKIGNVGQANYAASKAGLIGLTKSAAREFASRNITVNAVCPGFIKTAMTDKLSEEAVNNIVSKIPLRDLGSVDDVANLVAFLASDDAKYITGQAISVDGGMSMQ